MQIPRRVLSDHVHLVVSIPPKYAVSSFMGYLKGKLAIRLFDRYEKLEKREKQLEAIRGKLFD
jgi:putative transposase